MFLSLVTFVTLDSIECEVKILLKETSEIYVELLIIEILILAFSIILSIDVDGRDDRIELLDLLQFVVIIDAHASSVWKNVSLRAAFVSTIS